jgi:hypothetical protein
MAPEVTNFGKRMHSRLNVHQTHKAAANLGAVSLPRLLAEFPSLRKRLRTRLTEFTSPRHDVVQESRRNSINTHSEQPNLDWHAGCRKESRLKSDCY